MNSLLVVVLILAILPIVLKLYLKLTTAWDRSYTCLVGKTALVTGSNTGIGFYTAQNFAKRGAKVILACRDKNRAEDARKRMREATGNENIHVVLVDFASLDSVRAAAREINSKEERLHILVNNAGGAGTDKIMTKDGLQLLMQINHFGPFLFTLLLTDLMKKSAPSRIINLSSSAFVWNNLNPKKLNHFNEGLFGKTINYSNTKICNHLFTLELTKRLKGTGVDVNSVHPGTVDTDIFRKLPKIGKVVADIMRMFFMTVAEGAQTSIYASVSKDIKGNSGNFFASCKAQPLPFIFKVCRDEKIIREVWDQSWEFVRVSPNELTL